MTLPGFLQTPGRMILQPYSLLISKWSRSGILVIDRDRWDNSTIDRGHDRDRAQAYWSAYLLLPDSQSLQCRWGNDWQPTKMEWSKDAYYETHSTMVSQTTARSTNIGLAISVRSIELNISTTAAPCIWASLNSRYTCFGAGADGVVGRNCSGIIVQLGHLLHYF